jgi:rare lipoprotein A (peptidoglycan hydrolase)
VRAGRIIDLTRAAYERLAPADLGLVSVSVHRVRCRDSIRSVSTNAEPRAGQHEY